MRKLALTAAALAAPLMLAGCDKIPFLNQSDEAKIVGEWECESDDMPSGVETVIMEFEKGGDLKINMAGNMNEGGQSMELDVDLKGDWEIDGKDLTLKLTGAKLNKMKLNGNDMSVDMMGGQDAFEKQMMSSAEDGEFEIKRLAGDRMTLVDKENDDETKCTKE